MVEFKMPDTETGWMEIASAPKDGTYVLGYGQHKTRGHYIGDIHYWGDRWTIQWMDGYEAPTHWMQLPTPPKP